MDAETNQGGLRVRLESPLPASLEAGRATALFCSGICFHADAAVSGVTLLVDGERHRPAAAAMPRPDAVERLSDPRAYRSGFWGTVPVPAHDRAGAVRLELLARIETGEELVASLGEIAVVEPPRPEELAVRPAAPADELIAVCMATFDPDPELFSIQIESLRSQSDEGWVCVISDDCSSEESFETIVASVAGDERFAVSRSARRLGFYRNFERAIGLAPEGAGLLALCDQDDRWHPDKLARMRAGLGDAGLVYCDQRLVDAGGKVLAETLWEGRRNNRTDIVSMLVANSITGAATLFRRGVAELMLPFPDTPGLQFHDHWLGLAALTAGDLAYVDRPLYDYVQHRGAVFSEVALQGETALGPRSMRARVERWRVAYFYGYLGREVQAQVLLARGGERLDPAKRRALARFVAADRSLAALAWLALRSLRRFAGRDETLGSESELAWGLVWRRLTSLRAGRRREPGRRPLHASFPPVGPEAFEQRRLRRWRAGRASG